MSIRPIAFYLPQFHPIPENDEWWGKGFTEWTNVAKARPLFRGHYQPHIPADLGFYDLRLAAARQAQAELARDHGIEGFCYWHYWFKGKRLLEQPFNNVLASGEPDFPFCLAWANETWSRRWTGEERDILQEQTYSAEDDENHARWLLPVFADRRCIRVNGRPLFLIYRPADLPDSRRTTDTIRAESVRNGLPEPFILGVNAHCPELDCRTIGFDGTVNFMPHLGFLPDAMNDMPSESKRTRNLSFGVRNAKLKLYDYSDALTIMLTSMNKRNHPVYPSIFVGWDNTPRRGENGVIVANSSPEKYRRGLSQLCEYVQNRPEEERLVFINAWNEWAEGNHLEPDQRWGKGFLEATREVVHSSPFQSPEEHLLVQSNTTASASSGEYGELDQADLLAQIAEHENALAELQAKLSKTEMSYQWNDNLIYKVLRYAGSGVRHSLSRLGNLFVKK